jgi:methionine biosynthesis protein MetW
MMPHYVNSLSHTDRDRIHSMIPADTRVLDLGCGDCSLLGELVSEKNVVGVGVDIDGRRLIDGMKYGLSVYHGDLDAGLADFPDGSFDYVILNQTLQVVKHPLLVIREMLRIGRYGVVGFPNFGHWRLRTGLFFDGRAPKSPTLPFEWYDTPNIRQLSIKDFRDYCSREGIAIVREEYLFGSVWRRSRIFRPAANIFALIGIFVITQNGK